MIENAHPIACSLSARETRDQIGEWRALSARRVVSERIEGGYAVTFDPEVAPAVEDLARREAACCAFLTIDVARTEHGVRLIMTSENPDALPVIEMLVSGSDRTS